MDFELPEIAAIDAARPVFLMVTGIWMALTAWRLSRHANLWTARTLVAGATLLTLGYVIIIPAHEAGLLQRHGSEWLLGGCRASGFAWHTSKLAVMNLGWLLFGTGIALHAHSLLPRVRRPQEAPALSQPREILS